MSNSTRKSALSRPIFYSGGLILIISLYVLSWPLARHAWDRMDPTTGIRATVPGLYSIVYRPLFLLAKHSDPVHVFFVELNNRYLKFGLIDNRTRQTELEIWLRVGEMVKVPFPAAIETVFQAKLSSVTYARNGTSLDITLNKSLAGGADRASVRDVYGNPYWIITQEATPAHPHGIYNFVTSPSAGPAVALP